MERVVYLLGAGFSAPLDLPVMSNFLEKSKDLYFSGDPKFKHFGYVFKTIRDLSVAKNYYDTDLHNVEEILSILEMQDSLTATGRRKRFQDYIIDVISHYTPEDVRPNNNTAWPRQWEKALFGQKGGLSEYTYFVGCLFSLKFILTQLTNEGNYSTGPIVFQVKPGEHSYSVVTLNYDTILESASRYMNDTFGYTEIGDRVFESKKIDFCRNEEDVEQAPALAKLHGCVDAKSVVPPTWNKSLHKGINREWKLAYEVLKRANHIRILGYSLPVADTYVKYLLKSAIIETKNLKSLHVICLDDEKGSVKARYSAFIDYPNYKFVNANVATYLSNIRNSVRKSYPATKSCDGFDRLQMSLDGVLEEAHSDFVSTHHR